jgi:hypothetical protein
VVIVDGEYVGSATTIKVDKALKGIVKGAVEEQQA